LYGHNWLICSRDRDISRKALFYRRRRDRISNRLCMIKALMWKKLYQRWREYENSQTGSCASMPTWTEVQAA
jgi:hypothetical protein